MLHQPSPGDLPRGWEAGQVTFRNPLVLQLSSDMHDPFGPGGWKARLHNAFGKKGKALSCELKRRGYDGIVTCSSYGRGIDDTREIVDLSVVDCSGRR